MRPVACHLMSPDLHKRAISYVGEVLLTAGGCLCSVSSVYLGDCSSVKLPEAPAADGLRVIKGECEGLTKHDTLCRCLVAPRHPFTLL